MPILVLRTSRKLSDLPLLGIELRHVGIEDALLISMLGPRNKRERKNETNILTTPILLAIKISKH